MTDRRFNRAEAERNVRAIQDRRARSLGTQAVPDLSPEAIRLRHEAEGEGKNATGRQLAARAGRVLAQAEKLTRQLLQRPPNARRTKRMHAAADDALRTAAVQIRIAARVPLDRGYLHALDIRAIQDIEEEVARLFAADPAALAVDTHRRVREQKLRAGQNPKEA